MSKIRFRILHTASGYKVQIKAFGWRDCDQKAYASRLGGTHVWVTNYYPTQEEAEREMERLVAMASHKNRVVREIEVTV